jgi:hypothetical protein
MKTVQVFDRTLPANPEWQRRLAVFAADVEWARQDGATIEHYHQAEQPRAFAETPAVRAALEAAGEEALPLILVDGVVVMAGAYPSRVRLARLTGLADAAPPPKNPCCGPTGCS